jgi:hypothetical protein
MRVITHRTWRASFVRGSLVVVLIAGGCGSDRGTQDTGVSSPVSSSTAVDNTVPSSSAVDNTVANTTASGSITTDSSAPGVLYECYTSHGIAATDPAQPPAAPIGPAHPYPPDVAMAAWDACRTAYLDSLRWYVQQLRGSDEPVIPTQGDALAFADCMATFGWVKARGYYGLVEDLEGYMAANGACKAPAQGESAEASYCRFLNSIEDVAGHDPSMSITGTPYEGGDESRLEAAVRLYDEALQIAPADLVADLQALREGFRAEPGASFPVDVGERVKDYHLRVCGAFVYLGSLD